MRINWFKEIGGWNSEPYLSSFHSNLNSESIELFILNTSSIPFVNKVHIILNGLEKNRIDIEWIQWNSNVLSCISLLFRSISLSCDKRKSKILVEFQVIFIIQVLFFNWKSKVLLVLTGIPLVIKEYIDIEWTSDSDWIKWDFNRYWMEFQVVHIIHIISFKWGIYRKLWIRNDIPLGIWEINWYWIDWKWKTDSDWIQWKSNLLLIIFRSISFPWCD